MLGHVCYFRFFCKFSPTLSFAGCFTGDGSGVTGSKWSYCDVPFCDSDNRYVKLADCRSKNQTFGAPAIPPDSDFEFCREQCDADTACKGFVYHENAAPSNRCILNSENCETSICNPEIAANYYEKRYIEKRPDKEVLLKIHVVPVTRKEYIIRCFLYGPFYRGPVAHVKPIIWEKYVDDKWIATDNMDGIAESFFFKLDGEGKWVVSDAPNPYHQWQLETLRIPVNDTTPTRHFRCSRNKEFEYHTLRFFGKVKCSVHFNQIFPASFLFNGSNFHFRVMRDVLTSKNASYPLQWDLVCKTNRPVIRCLSKSFVVCYPVVLVYLNNRLIDNTLLGPFTENSNRQFHFQYGSHLKSEMDNGETTFYFSINLKNIDRSWNLYSQSVNYRQYSLVLFYPQLETSHAFIMEQNPESSVFKFEKTFMDNLPSLPLIPTGANGFEEGMGMDCFAESPYVSGRSKVFQISTKNAVPFYFTFVCILRLDQTGTSRPTLCFGNRKHGCFPVNLVVYKDGEIAFRGDWQNGDKLLSRIDISHTSPRFKFSSPSETELKLEVVFNADVAQEDNWIFGRYDLGFSLYWIEKQTDAAVELEEIQLPHFQQFGECIPHSYQQDWEYYGRLSKSQCGHFCLPWSHPNISNMVENFRKDWFESRPDLPFHLDVDKSHSFCRTASIASLGNKPICLIENPSSRVIMIEQCGVPPCNGEGQFLDGYVEKSGSCNCFPTIANSASSAASLLYRTGFSASKGIDVCRRDCDRTENCLGFNYDDSSFTCELKGCACIHETTECLHSESRIYLLHFIIVLFYFILFYFKAMVRDISTELIPKLM